MKKNLDKIVAQDAYDFGFAQMFFGEGAGTRRKLIGAAVMHKRETIPEYADKFDAAFARLNQVEIAEKALAERKKLDRMAKAGQNFRALKNGNLRGLTNGIFAVGGVVYLAHVTGYDKKIEVEAKKLYKKAKTEVKYRKARMEGRNVTKIV